MESGDPTWEREVRRVEIQEQAEALLTRMGQVFGPTWLAEWKDYGWSYEELEWLKSIQWPGE